MRRKLFDQNDELGITRWAYLDDEKDELHIETVQDYTPIIEANKRAMNDSGGRRARYNDGMHHVATLPLNLLEKLMADGILKVGKNGDGEGNKRWKAWLNDPENRFFRTREGKI